MDIRPRWPKLMKSRHFLLEAVLIERRVVTAEDNVGARQKRKDGERTVNLGKYLVIVMSVKYDEA